MGEEFEAPSSVERSVKGGGLNDNSLFLRLRRVRLGDPRLLRLPSQKARLEIQKPSFTFCVGWHAARDALLFGVPNRFHGLR